MVKQDEGPWDFSSDNEVAFRKMFEHYYADLCIYAKRYIPDLNTREDLVQDVFCSLWINRKKIDYSTSPANYLITSVKHHCLNYLRKTDKQPLDHSTEIEKLPVYAQGDDQFFILKELKEMFDRTLESLPEEYRIAFQMSRMENKTTTEIAESLGVSVRTVERYRNKAIEILRTELKDYLPLILVLLGINLLK